jgi:hypothetical protein
MKLHQEARKALQASAVRDRLAKLGADPMDLTAPAFEKLVRDEVSINTRIATAVGVAAN